MPDRPVWIIEPHADDAWLSLGQHIIGWRVDDRHVTIVTVYGDEQRSREARDYAAATGSAHVALGVPEGGQGLSGVWMTELPSGVLDAALRAAAAADAVVVVPLGLRHPEHRAVAAEFARAWSTAAWKLTRHLYVELPYALTQANGSELREAVRGRRVESMAVRSAAANAAAPIFRSQSMFWRNNRERMVGAMEVVLS